MNIAELTDGAGNVDIPEAEVTEVGETRTVNTRFGTEARVADVKIKDDTAEITLSLWNDDIEKVQQGTKIKIGNGYTNSFRGEVKLNVGRYGTLEIRTDVEGEKTREENQKIEDELKNSKKQRAELEKDIANKDRQIKSFSDEIIDVKTKLNRVNDFLKLKYNIRLEEEEKVIEFMNLAHLAENYGINPGGKTTDKLKKEIHSAQLRNRGEEFGIEIENLSDKEIEEELKSKQEEQRIYDERINSEKGGYNYRD
jgi:replication factor A1